MFTGFTDKTVDFLWGIRFNNDRTWFENHKDIYLEHLYRPMQALGAEIHGFLAEQRPELICKVTRIYRDARRLHGRGLYKESLWFTVERPSQEWSCRPAFWFELMPDGWSYGLGYWMPKPVTMAKLRARVDRDPATIRSLMGMLRDQSEFSLETVDYRRPRSTPPSPELAVWYRAKSLSISHRESLTEDLYSRSLVERLEKGLMSLLPWYDYLDSLDAEPDPLPAPRKAARGHSAACIPRT